MIGHGTHRYEVINDWGELNPTEHPVADCHEMVIDKSGRLFMLTNETKNNILIYELDGTLIGSWGTTYPGAHGLSIGEENGQEFLLITDIVRHQVIKTTLDGVELMIINAPQEICEYQNPLKFNPTETAIAPNGDIYVADGYGLQYIIRFNKYGRYMSHFGGHGHENDQFDCAHGIAIDKRKHKNPTLIITSRNHNQFKRFTLDGEYLGSIDLPGSFVCRPVIKGKYLYAAVFRSGSNMNFGSGYITILDEKDEVISSPGASTPIYYNGILQEQTQYTNTFIHPHDVCVDEQGNIIVCQWKANNSYPIFLRRIYS